MRMTNKAVFTLTVFVSLGFTFNASAQLISMPSREGPIGAPDAKKYQASVAEYGGVVTVGEIVLPPPSTAEVVKAKFIGGPNKTAFGRTPTNGPVHIEIPAGVQQAKFTVTSTGAKGIRAALQFNDNADYKIAAWSPGSDVAVLMASTNPRTFGVPTWTPFTSGAQQVLVVTRGQSDGQAWSIDVSMVSHFQLDALSGSQVQPDIYGEGTSAYCQVDVVCVLDVLTPSQQQSLLGNTRPVMLLILTYSDGSAATCTGTLLNTASYPATIILTANHCVTGDSGTEALSGLTTVWFFSRSICGSTALGNYVQVVNTGRILWHSLTYDGALLYANEPPPYPASYEGWDAGQVISSGTQVFAIHHPRADVKKASFATVVGTNSTPVTIGGITRPPGIYYLVDWEVGIVEPGSSGSGLFAFDATYTGLTLRATLTGGNDVCGSPSNRTYYSELANMYPEIQSFLKQPVAPPSPALALENPQPASFQSGVGLISGWSCQGPQIGVAFDGTTPVNVPYGSGRGDTASVCGANNTNTGFGLLLNYNLLGSGQHTAQLFVNGQPQGSPAQFTVTVPVGEFLAGVSQQVTVTNFPPGKTTVLTWQQSQQNFAIMSVSP